MGEFEKRLAAKLKKGIPVMKALEVVDEAKKDIFPLPKGDLPINPKTGQRDIIVLDLKDWTTLINNLRKWF